MELLTLIPLSIWDPFIAFGSAIMQPLYWVVSGILVLASRHLCAGVRRRQRLDLGAVHHVPHRCHPDRLDPAVRQADQVLTQHAAAAAQGARAAEETWS